MLLDFYGGLWLSVCLSALGIVIMNIFYLDSDPRKAAEYHHDIHLRKMILETAQLLSTAHHVNGSDVDLSQIYKSTHKNHPSAIWVRETSDHYRWAYSLFSSLIEEYQYRFDRIHKSSTISNFLSGGPRFENNISFSPPPLAMPDEYKCNDQVESYRNYYRNAKLLNKNGKSMAKWTKRPTPFWLEVK